RGRAALETLQRVNGRIASLARVDDVAHAALTYGALGIRSDGGALLLVDESGLTIKETIDSPLGRGADWTDAICRTARDAVDAQTTVFSTFDGPSSQYSVVGIPLQIMNRVIGAVVFSFADCRELSAEEMSMLATLGSRCAGAMERASLYERERTIALTLQHRLLSSLPPTPDWIDAAACYVPASGLEIGGDWFQILDAGEGRIVAIIGDAVGHALSAAAAMGQLRASIATAVANDPDPVNALAAVDVFAGRGADTEAASMALILFQPDGLAHYASAGHPPIVVAPANEAARLVETGRGPLLGFRGDRRYASETLKLLDGDVVVMYTDGLVERRGEPFDDGLDHLLEAVEGCKHLCAQDICDSLIARLGAQGQPIDDVAVLVLRRRSGPEAALEMMTQG
ncbi:MAG: SpoIIE family protein phosphatase, partial [Ilumatobacteraceae bacterium]